jgi:hypothetical protein
MFFKNNNQGMAMAGFAIFRAEGKYKAGGALRGKHSRNLTDLAKSVDHIQRTGTPVLNAVTPYDSRNVAGNFDLMAGIESCLPEKRKKDAVLAVEIILTTSPESLRFNDDKAAALDPAKVLKFENAAQKFIKRWGACAHLRAHYDETTPHYQGYIVPNEGFVPGAPLNAKKMLGPDVMERYQTEWAEFLQAEGLDVKRGQPGSMAEHEPIADYYARVNTLAPVPPALLPKPPAPTTAEKIKEASGVETDRLKAQKLHDQSRLEQYQFYKNTYVEAAAKSLEAEAKAERMEVRAKKAESKLSKIKSETDQLRALPLKTVMEMLGCEQHKTERLRYKTPAGDVWLEKDGLRFNSFDNPDIKGRGAIDLVMKINGSPFDQAASWLASNFGVEQTAKDAAGLLAQSALRSVLNAVERVAEPKALPTPRPDRLQRVAAYLIEIRGIPLALVKKLTDAGRIYGDKFANAIFLTDTGKGCEIRGTGDTAFHGQFGPKDGFTVEGDLKKVAIVESAIEALSLHATSGMTTVSVGGSNLKKSVEIALGWLAKGATVFAAQNNDAAGDKQAAALIAAAPEVHRLKPVRNDWNEDVAVVNRQDPRPASTEKASPAPSPR